MIRWLRLVHVSALALLVGFMALVQWSLVPAQDGLDARGYATLEQGMNRTLEWLTPTLMVVALIAGVAVLVLARQEGQRGLLLPVLGVLGLVVMIVSTLVVNAPVNAEIDGWSLAAPPADWAARRDRWEFGHALRSYVGLVVLVAVLGDLVRRAGPVPSRS